MRLCRVTAGTAAACLVLTLAVAFAAQEVADADAVDAAFLEALADDLNTPAAMARLHEFAGAANRGDASAAVALKSSAAILGLLEQTGDEWARAGGDETGMSDAEIDAAIEARKQARANRDFAAADRIRDDLAAQRILLEDGPEGTIWRRS